MLLFCYGVLLNSAVWVGAEDLQLSPRFVYRAKLPNHKLVFDGKSKLRPGATANIQPSTEQVVWGGVFRVNLEEFKSLDAYEGVPTNYNRTTVVVEKDDGFTIQAFIYQRSGFPPGTPSREYIEEIIQGANECGLPKEYLQFLERFQTC